MRLLICTLAICLSVLASALALRELILAEGRLVRQTVAQALTEQALGVHPEQPALQRLGNIQTQLETLNRRLALIEDAASRGGRADPVMPAAAGPTQAEWRALTSSMQSFAATQARLAHLPTQLADLATFINARVGDLEKRIHDGGGAPEDLIQNLEQVAAKIATLESYFTPLYAFLGLVYDPAHERAIADYPSLDVRLNALAAEMDALRKTVAEIHNRLTRPLVIEPVKRPR